MRRPPSSSSAQKLSSERLGSVGYGRVWRRGAIRHGRSQVAHTLYARSQRCPHLCSHVNTISRRVLGPATIGAPLLPSTPPRSAGTPGDRSWPVLPSPETQRVRPMSASATVTPSTRHQHPPAPLPVARPSRSSSAPARRASPEHPSSAHEVARCVWEGGRPRPVTSASCLPPAYRLLQPCLVFMPPSTRSGVSARPPCDPFSLPHSAVYLPPRFALFLSSKQQQRTPSCSPIKSRPVSALASTKARPASARLRQPPPVRPLQRR